MRITLYSASDAPICSLDDDTKMVGFYPVQDFMRIHVVDTNPHRVKGAYTDVSQVKKFEISDEEYSKRSDSVRAFKQRMKLGRFADGSSEASASTTDGDDFSAAAAKIKVGDRCEVTVDDEGGLAKRGEVKFVGLTKFKPGYWIGIEYDEPLGKHDGSVDGQRYFDARPRHGAFARPNKVRVGDYPEEDLMDEIMFGPNADYGTRKPPGTKVFSPEELAKYNGADAAQPVYLALKGVVYDVSSARNMYAPGSGYSAFAGKDASRALGMSSLKAEDCVADYSTLNAEQLFPKNGCTVQALGGGLHDPELRLSNHKNALASDNAQLMNPLLGTTKTYKDPQMCIYQLASGYCPYDLFTNTKCDIGVCDKKLHDEKLVAAYQASPDRYHLGHEQQFYNLANRLVQDMDRTVRRQKEKVNVQMGLDEAGQQAYGGVADAMKNEDDEKEERVAMLEGQIKEHLAQIMELGNAGSVDRAIDMWVTVELLKQNIEAIRNVRFIYWVFTSF
ncbi:hypothetical protein HDU84_000101 [Entophlyctis sp. JEL0112]|nr:hypothetical protein HDU84_000101 [Entophlyctis sp. JEL0112]